MIRPLLAAFALPLLALPALAHPSPLAGQAASDVRLSVFFDCDGPRCDGNSRTQYRTEIDWINWVNDREVSDVHVILTSEESAGGGREYQIDFIGQGELEDYVDELFFRSVGTDTEQEERDGITTTLAIGLARFATFMGGQGLVQVSGDPEGQVQQGLVTAQEVDDPWNLWVFRVGGSGNLDGESTRETLRFNVNASASRTTPVWKLSFGGRGSFDRREIERNDSTTFVNEQTEWSWNNLVAYALADHWSIGVNSRFAKTPRDNQDFTVSFRPGIEWSYFPYEEATRRALTVFYQVGPQYWDYEEETIYLETEELRFEESIEVQFSQRQTWGDASISIEGSHFLHDFGLNRISFDGDVSFRITRGLSLTASANYSVINDQLFLSGEGATDEEILLRLQSRETDRDYCINIGFSYQFGSIFNNVVNNRFPGGGGFGGGGFGGGGCRGGFG